MNKLPKDIVILIGLKLDLKSVLNTSLSSRRYNNILCDNQIFWMNRLKDNYGQFGHVPSQIRNKKNDMTWKEYYEILYKISIYFENFDEEILYTFCCKSLCLNLLNEMKIDYRNLLNDIRIGYMNLPNGTRILLNDDRIDPSSRKNLAIILFSINGQAKIVEWLLEDGRVDPSSNYNCAIKHSSKKGHTEVVRLLLTDERVNPSDGGNWAMFLASEYGRTEVVRLLLEDGRADPSANNNSAIIIASKNGHVEVVRLLLKDRRVNPATDGNFPLREAIRNDHIELAKLLLSDQKVDISKNNDIYNMINNDPRFEQ